MCTSFRLLALLAVSLALSVTSLADECDPVEIQKIVVPDGAVFDQFGVAVDIDGDVAVIGAHTDDDGALDSGTAYVYRWSGFAWIQEATLVAPDADESEFFGQAVSIGGDVVAIGVEWNDDRGPRAGAAYIYRYDGERWNFDAKLFGSDTDANDNLGRSVSVSGDVVAVTAPAATAGSVPSAGAAYIFRYNGTDWIEEAKVIASDAEEADGFGYDGEVVGSQLVIGARYDDDLGVASGAAYVFRFDGQDWVEEAKVVPSDGESLHFFGYLLTADDGVFAVSAYPGAFNNAGSVYVYRFDGTTWSEEAKLTASDPQPSAFFGQGCSIDGDILMLGANGDNAIGEASGAAYLFAYNDQTSTWVEQAKLTASDGAPFDYLGYSVAVSGQHALVGSHLSNARGFDSGATYAFDLQCVDTSPTLTVDPLPLVAGEDATFTLRDGRPNALAFLGYSVSGLGQTYLPPLNVTVDLARPEPVTLPQRCDVDGVATWTRRVPVEASGRPIWLQAAQFELKTNVVETSIQ